MLPIAFGHRKRVGKDTCAKFLLQQFRLSNSGLVVKASFADHLKRICFDLWEGAGIHPGPYYEIEQNISERNTVLRHGKTVRQTWIEAGNKLREVDPDVWVNIVFDKSAAARYVIIPDLRYPNEVERVRAFGGLCVKVVNPRIDDTHDVADDALSDYDGWDEVLVNDGSLNDLYAKIADLRVKHELR
jgi:hypothetical protein